MIKRIFFILIIFFLSGTFLHAETFTFDTRIGVYGAVPYRLSSLSCNIAPLFTGRVEYNVYNGIGFTGEFNNYKLGLQGIYEVALPGTGFTLKPFVGIGFSNSGIASNSLSLDFGFDSTYNNLFGVILVIGAEAVTFSDSYMVDYYGGPSIPIINFLSVDLLYTGLISNGCHQIGFGGRVNFKF